jgi:hypothetical protein
VVMATSHVSNILIANFCDMKLINYNYGYINHFDCVIKGKIIVSKKEWRNILAFLQRTKADTSYPFYKTMVKQDSLRVIKTKFGDLCNIRVWATEKVVQHWRLPKYKKVNYMFLILK